MSVLFCAVFSFTPDVWVEIINLRVLIPLFLLQINWSKLASEETFVPKFKS